MRSKKKILVAAVSVALVLACLICYVLIANKALGLTEYTVTSECVPAAFDGFRIAQVSDLHNTELGENHEKTVAVLRKAAPDIIVITGDMIDSRRTDVQTALDFAERAVEIAPCYYVAGNHESRLGEYADLKRGLTELGVTVLENETVSIEIGGESITLIGIKDPAFYSDGFFTYDENVVSSRLDVLTEDIEGYTVLLSHRPELFDIYAEYGVDLVFSGHAHGGQFRLPLVGGLVAPDQGLFPKYDAGVFVSGRTRMVVSRGVGNSIIPVRVNNNPEVVLVELSVGQGM